MDIDIREDDLAALHPDLLAKLLLDHTTSRSTGRPTNIFWATDDYADLGEGFRYQDQITPDHITGRYGHTWRGYVRLRRFPRLLAYIQE